MSDFTKRQRGDLNQQTKPFQLKPVAAGCAVLLVGLMNAAYSQEVTPTAPTAVEDGNVVFVTGIRKGIEDAISVKKNSSSIVEAISAEDIGKLPDQSIAESIARLPGLAAQRTAGRAQSLSVRGLSPDFATTLMNGREQVSTGDNRSVEFDQYPSELMSGVVIYKTPDAGLVGQGLSGTIDMQTVSPLNFPGRTVSVNVRGEKNSLGDIANTKSTGNRESISYIDQFANHTIGIALGFAHMETPRLDNEVGLYEPWQIQSLPGVPAGTYVMDGIKSLATSGTIKRDGFMGVLEFSPSKNWVSKLDVFASKFSDVETANQFEFNLGNYNGGNKPGLNYDVANVSNGTLLGGVASGVYPLVRGEYNNRQDSIHSAGWANTFKFDKIKVLADLNYSEAKRDETYQEINTQLLDANGKAVLDTMHVNWATGGFPTLYGTQDYSNPNTLNLRNTIYGGGYGRKPHVDDKLTGGKLVGTFDAPEMVAGFISDIDVGINYTGRTKQKRQPEASENLLATNAVISSDLLYSPVNLNFAQSGTIPSFNVPGVISKYYQPWNPSPIDAGAVQRAWDVKEDVTTAFVKANLDSTVGSVPVKGNVGIQIVNTDQSSSAVYSTAGSGALTPVDIGAKYTDYLPSLNLAFFTGNDQTVRVAVAKQIARARVDDMRASFAFNIDDVTRTPSANGGNPKLDPWRANACDISYEKYFGKKAYVAVAGYYKQLTSYIYSQTKPYDFSAQINAGAKSPGGFDAVQNIGGYTSMYNGQGGSIEGLELSASLPLDMFTPVLNGFGVQASTTVTNSSITIPSATFAVGQNIPLPGMSKNVTNLTAYYEKNGFQLRISDRRRSDFIGEIGNFAGDRQLRYVVGENVVDFQAGYAFETGSMKGLSFVFQVNNLNNSAYQTYQSSKDHILEYEKYGRDFLFGANYKF